MTLRSRLKSNRDGWIPWAFVGFFAVVVVVNGVMIFVALRTWTGMSTQGAYERGLHFNDLVAEARAQEELGWTVTLDFAQTGADTGHLELALEDAWGNGLERAVVRAWLVRPSHEGDDFEADLTYAGFGVYAAEIRFPLRGVWDVRVQADHERGTYRLRERIYLR